MKCPDYSLSNHTVYALRLKCAISETGRQVCVHIELLQQVCRELSLQTCALDTKQVF